MVDHLSPLLLPDSFTPNGPLSAPRRNDCFACSPPYAHPRVWIPDPASRSAKTLVLCFDGTGDSFDEDNSNVVQFISMLKKDKGTEQLVYYQAGIGTYTSPVLTAPVIAGTSKVLDEMVAWNLDSHVKDGYRFLMQNYTEGSKICIFGFSRGAFTARALAGMLQKVGLLPTWNSEQLPFAWTMYIREDKEGWKLSEAFKRTFSIDVKIEFLGVWDTVQSVGLIPHYLPFSGSNNAIVYFRHALALDEHRVKFMPSYCTGGKSKAKEDDCREKHYWEASGSVETNEDKVNEASGIDTDVLEVFFAGAHCDVGGGSVRNDTRHSLARIPLRWIIRECFRCKTEIIFDSHMLQHEVGMDLDHLFEAPPRLKPDAKHLQPAEKATSGLVTFIEIGLATIGMPFAWIMSKVRSLRIRSRNAIGERSQRVSKGEQYEELEDALSPVYDQLSMHLYWKIMEYIPMITEKQWAEIDGSDEVLAHKLTWNRGASRIVYWPVMRRGMKVHRSVKTRMEALPDSKNEKYVPRIRLFIEGVSRARRLTVEEWLADRPEYFEWVD